MTNEKRLPPELDKKLRDYIKETHPVVVDFDYNISDDGELIHLTSHLTRINEESALQGIINIEKLLDVTYVNMVTIKGFYTYTYKFNK